MKCLKAYRKEQLGFTNKESEEGDIYFNEEWRFKKKIPFIREMIVTYELIGDYWIEQDYLDDGHPRKEQDPEAIQK